MIRDLFVVLVLVFGLGACAGSAESATGADRTCSPAFAACASNSTSPVRCADGICGCAAPDGVSSCQSAIWCSGLPYCQADSTGLCCQPPSQVTIPDFCAAHSFAEQSSETLPCSTIDAAACAFDANGQSIKPYPLIAGESLCECRTTDAHPDPAHGVYYCAAL